MPSSEHVIIQLRNCKDSIGRERINLFLYTNSILNSYQHETKRDHAYDIHVTKSFRTMKCPNTSDRQIFVETCV